MFKIILRYVDIAMIIEIYGLIMWFCNVMFVWFCNNLCATCIGEINICFIIWMCYNRYKQVLQIMCSFVLYYVL
jgi:hypothetical protein